MKIELFEKIVNTTPIEIEDDSPAPSMRIQPASPPQIDLDSTPSKSQKRRQNRKEAIKKLAKWGPQKVADWLAEDSELIQYKNVFKVNEVDGVELPTLTDKYLKMELGIEIFGHRMKILGLIDNLVANGVEQGIFE